MADKMLTRDDIINFSARKIHKLEISEMGGFLYVSELTNADAEKWENYINDISGDNGVKLGDMRARYIALGVTDSKGNKIFTEKDIDLINQWPAAVCEKIWSYLIALNGQGAEGQTELKKN